MCPVATFILFIMYICFQVQLFIPRSLANRIEVMFALEISGLPLWELLTCVESGFVEMVVYEGGEHLQASSGSLVNKSGQFLTHCPVSGPSRFSCCSISWGQGSLNPRHTRFLLLLSSFPLPPLIMLSLPCTSISNGLKIAFASVYSGGSWQFCGHNRRVFLGHCWLDCGEVAVQSQTGQRAFLGSGTESRGEPVCLPPAQEPSSRGRTHCRERTDSDSVATRGECKGKRNLWSGFGEAAHAKKGTNFSQTQADAVLGKKQVSEKASGAKTKGSPFNNQSLDVLTCTYHASLPNRTPVVKVFLCAVINRPRNGLIVTTYSREVGREEERLSTL